MFVGDQLGDRADAFPTAYRPDAVVSDFAAVEFASAINQLVRTRLLSGHQGVQVFEEFDQWRGRSATPHSIEAIDLAVASDVLRRLDLNLRTGDAIHIGIARRLGAELVTFDERMADCAVRLGVAVSPA